MNIRKISADNCIHTDDGFICTDSGKVKITQSRSVSFIKIEFDFCVPENALVLGDAWERVYGDLKWQKPDGRIYPWYLQIRDGNRFYGFGVKTGCNAFCHWEIGDDGLSLIMDVRCGTAPVTVDGTLDVCEIVTLAEETDNVFLSSRKFCRMMCETPLLPKEPVYGGNNWYYAYGSSSAAEITEDARRIAKWSEGLCNRPYMIIDDGWGAYRKGGDMDTCIGPYTEGNSLFPDMKGLAEKISEMDVKPGIWYRPLITSEAVPENWILYDRVLDPTVPEVCQQLKADAERFVSWGYKLLKHDFSTYDITGYWGFEMPCGIKYKNNIVFHDRTKTTAQALKMLYRAIYEGAGESYIIGCNTVGHLAAGLEHIQRIGDDTSGREWERTVKMGVNCLAVRLAQHNTFFAADADCVAITNAISPERTLEWLKLVAHSGTPLFVSASPGALNESIEEKLRLAFAYASKEQQLLVPQDIDDNLTPRHWKNADMNIEFDRNA